MRLIPPILRFGMVYLSCQAMAGDFKAGAYDELAREQLRATLAAAPLKDLTVRDLAPDFVVEKQDGLTWEAAVAEANRRFKEKQPERALFLRKYLTAGAPESQLDELGWPPAWAAFNSGPSTYSHLDWFGAEVHARLRAARDQNSGDWRKGMTLDLLQTKPLVRIDTAVVNRALTGAPRLSFPGAKVRGIAFALLTFDENDRLASVLRVIPIADTGATMQITYPWGPPGSGSWSVSITDRDHNWESLDYDPGLVLQRRWVQARGQTFHEIYEDGRLRKRVHTDDAPQLDEKGRYVEKAEVFP